MTMPTTEKFRTNDPRAQSLLNFLSDITATPLTLHFIRGSMTSPLPQQPGAFFLVTSGTGITYLRSGLSRRFGAGDLLFFYNFLFKDDTESTHKFNGAVELCMITGFSLTPEGHEALRRSFMILENYDPIQRLNIRQYNLAKAKEFYYSLSRCTFTNSLKNQQMNFAPGPDHSCLILLEGSLLLKPENGPPFVAKNKAILPLNSAVSAVALEPSAFVVGDFDISSTKLRGYVDRVTSWFEKIVANLRIEAGHFQREESTCGLEIAKGLLDFFGIEYLEEALKDRVTQPRKGLPVGELEAILISYGLSFSRISEESLQETAISGGRPILLLASAHYLSLVPTKSGRWFLNDPLGLQEQISTQEIRDLKFDFAYSVEGPSSVVSGSKRLDRNISSTTADALMTILRSNVVSIALLLALTIVSSVLALGPVFVIQKVVDRGLNHSSNLVLLGLLCAGVAVGLLNSTLEFTKEKLAVGFSRVFDVGLSTRLISKILEMDLARFHQRSIGDYNIRFNSIQTLRDFLTRSLINSVFNVFLLVILTIFLMTRSPFLGCLVFFFVPSLMLMLRSYQKSIRIPMWKSFYLQRQEKEQVIETLTRFLTLKSYGAEDFVGTKIREMFKLSADGKSRLDILRSKSKAMFESAEQSFLWIGYGVALYLGIKGDITFGQSTASIVVLSMVLKPAQSLAFVARDLIEARWALSSIDDILSSTSTTSSSSSSLPQSTNRLTKFEVRDLSFRYPNEDRWLIQNLNLSASPGDRIALVGTNGSGKSTLARILAGLASPTSGAFYANGVEVSGPMLSKLVTYQPQDCEFFSDSIGNNIMLGKPAPGKQPACSMISELGLESLASTPQGVLDLKLVNGEKFLSGGERQKVGLVRLLYHARNVVIADEITSAMDATSQERAFRLLTEGCRDRILICTVHDPGALKFFNRVLHLPQGTFEGDS